MVKSNDTPLSEILKDIHDGAICLPDFQRGWVWDDERICGLIASITRSYPVGAVMFLECGGDGIRFKSRLFTNVPDEDKTPEVLVLDGQQRLTSAYCAMYSKDCVPTQTTKKEKSQRYYYLNIDKCLDPEADRVEGVVSVPADRKIKEDFGRAIVADLSTSEGEFKSHMFPLNIVFDPIASEQWKYGYQDFHGNDREKRERLYLFTQEVLHRIIRYSLPVIQLDKSTPKEAVCQVFEKVNTGGVQLTVFELVTATFAADDFGLRDDWDARNARMKDADGAFDLLSVVTATDFLISMTLLAQARGGKALTAKRENVLSLKLDDYKAYADDLTGGYVEAARFLVQQSIFAPRDLPYDTQFVPLSVLMTVIGGRARDGVVRKKLASWFWCGVFGEMYSSATETRFANDVRGVLEWIDGGGEPDTVGHADFQPKRLLHLKTRGGAAYKGIMALILGEGARDFISGVEMGFTNFIAEGVDIHHIFPRKYCAAKGYDEDKWNWNCIVNKTPIAYHTNRMIGGNAPSKYLKAIEGRNVSADSLVKNVGSHGIDVNSLRNDDYATFFALRAKVLLDLIHGAMGKQPNNPNGSGVVEAFRMPLEQTE